MKRPISWVLICSIVILISGCGSSAKYKEDLKVKYAKYTLESYQFSEKTGPAISSLIAGAKPSISQMQSELDDVIEVLRDIKGLKPPAKVKSKHNELVTKIAEDTNLKNELAMFLGTGQIDNATDAFSDLLDISNDITDLYEDIQDEL